MIYLITRGEKITYSLNSPEIKTLYTSDARLATLIFWYGDLSYSLCADEFTFLVETIIGQMLSNKAANAIITRLYSLCNGILTPEKLLILGRSNLKAIGLSRQKVEYIFDFAEMLSNQPDFFVGLDKATDNEVIEVLISLHGIGIWSTKMYLIFVLNRLNVLPYEDGAFIQSYKWLYETTDINHNSIKQRCAPWTPFASLASRYLYRALDEGLTKDLEFVAKHRDIER